MRAVSRPDERAQQVRRALRLAYVSIGWGLASGAFAVTIGVLSRSLGVLGVGFGVLGDVGGSAAVAWRARAERRDAAAADRAEAVASRVVVVALLLASAVLVVGAVVALRAGSRPDSTVIAMASAGVNVVVLLPLGRAKRRLGTALASDALRGDGLLSILGACMATFALVALVLDRVLGWWWADRVAALVVAAIAAAEAARIARARRGM
jgi:divalent metal cation (Fe/Co/Zn/Cd) transporter